MIKSRLYPLRFSDILLHSKVDVGIVWKTVIGFSHTFINSSQRDIIYRFADGNRPA